MWVGLRQCVDTFSGEKGHTDTDMIWCGMVWGTQKKKKKTSSIHHLRSYVLKHNSDT